VVIYLNINTPRTAKIKYTKSSRANTFESEGIEKVIVWINAYSPLYLFSNLKSLLTLRTLSTLANCGATLNGFKVAVDSYPIIMSKKLDITTNTSNLCQVGAK